MVWKKGAENVTLCRAVSVCVSANDQLQSWIQFEKNVESPTFVLNFTKKIVEVLQLSYNLRKNCPTKEEKMSLNVLKSPTIWFSENSSADREA